VRAIYKDVALTNAAVLAGDELALAEEANVVDDVTIVLVGAAVEVGSVVV
jgi:quinolinate synthase